MTATKSKQANLEQLLALKKAIDTPYITYDDMVKLLKSTLTPLKELKAELVAENLSNSKLLLQKVETAISETQSNIKSAVSELKKVEKESIKRTNEIQKLVVDFSAQIRSEIPDTTYLRLAIEELSEREVEVEEVTPEEIRDKLETLENEERLNWSAIEGLEDLIRSIAKEMKPTGGTTANMQVSHYPRHEQFTMDGVATSVTLLEAPSADGKAAWVHYNGQFLALANTYTVSGNKITFTFTPEADTTVEVVYIP